MMLALSAPFLPHAPPYSHEDGNATSSSSRRQVAPVVPLSGTEAEGLAETASLKLRIRCLTPSRDGLIFCLLSVRCDTRLPLVGAGTYHRVPFPLSGIWYTALVPPPRRRPPRPLHGPELARHSPARRDDGGCPSWLPLRLRPSRPSRLRGSTLRSPLCALGGKSPGSFSSGEVRPPPHEGRRQSHDGKLACSRGSGFVPCRPCRHPRPPSDLRYRSLSTVASPGEGGFPPCWTPPSLWPSRPSRLPRTVPRRPRLWYWGLRGSTIRAPANR